MLFAYFSLDDVNQELAAKLSAAAGIEVEVCSTDLPLHRAPDAVLYDLDYLPPNTLRMLLTQLAAARPPYVVAVHSYRLLPRQVRALRQFGVIIARRLGVGVINRLRLAETVAGRT
jgi:hypothetical protein